MLTGTRFFKVLIILISRVECSSKIQKQLAILLNQLTGVGLFYTIVLLTIILPNE